MLEFKKSIKRSKPSQLTPEERLQRSQSYWLAMLGLSGKDKK